MHVRCVLCLLLLLLLVVVVVAAVVVIVVVVVVEEEEAIRKISHRMFELEGTNEEHISIIFTKCYAFKNSNTEFLEINLK